MVAINFSPRFAPLVASGKKRQTIRRTLRCAPGDDLQLFTGQRTAECYKLVNPDPICLSVQSVKIRPTGLFLDGEPVDPATHDIFAQEDGFCGFAAMWEWFRDLYRISEVNGFLIKW